MFIKLEVLESVLIVGLGMFMHFHGLSSVMQLQPSKFPLLAPNTASCLFVFSILCLLTKMRSLWPPTTRMPQRFMVFTVQLALILYANEFILSYLWLPSLKVINYLCLFMGQWIVTANQSFFNYNTPELSHFMRNDFFYVTRFLLALITFAFTLKITGLMKHITKYILNITNNKRIVDLTSTNDQYRENYYGVNVTGAQAMDAGKQMPFDVYDLPCVPQEDILSLSNRVVSQRKRRKSKSERKTKRRTKILLNDDEHDEASEYNC